MFDLAPAFRQQYFNSNGAPLSGGQIWTYGAGTTTPLATYTDSGGLTPNQNPVILDSAGQAPIWMGPSVYKFVVEDSLGNIIETVDNIQSVGSIIAGITSQFQEVTVLFSQLSAAALTKNIALFTIPARCILKNVIIKHSQSFTGGSVSAVQAQIGLTGTFTDFIEGFDIFQAIGDQVFDNATLGKICSFANVTTVYLNAISVGANLSALTQGSLTVAYEIANFTGS